MEMEEDCNLTNDSFYYRRNKDGRIFLMASTSGCCGDTYSLQFEDIDHQIEEMEQAIAFLKRAKEDKELWS